MYNKLWVEEASVNECAVTDFAAELKEKPSKAWLVLEPLLLLKAITLIDLTTLAGDDTKSNVGRLVNKAIHPLRVITLMKLHTTIVNLVRQVRAIESTHLARESSETVFEYKGHQLRYEDLVELQSLLRRLGFDSGDVSRKFIEFLVPNCAENDIKLTKEEFEIYFYTSFSVGAICVYPKIVNIVASVQEERRSLQKAVLDDSDKDIKMAQRYGVPIAAVAASFPAGQYSIDSKIMEIDFAVQSGASEIDIVISRGMVIGECWEELYDEIKTLKKACGQATMKTILATGECGSLQNVYKASMVAMMAGSDYIKTSTGKESVNATLPVGIVMCRAIRNFYINTGKRVGFKPAGGLRTAEDTLQWLKLIVTELGVEWLPYFRIGASGLLDNIEKRLLAF